MIHPNKTTNNIIAISVVIVWGTTFAATKTLLTGGMSECGIFFLRFVIGYLLLLAISHKRFLSKNWRDEFLLLVAGIFGGSFYYVVQNYALRFAQTTDVSFIVCLSPLLTTLLALLFFRHKNSITKNFILGLLIALAGIGFLVTKGNVNMNISLRGDLLALIAALSWAIYSLVIKPLSGKYSVSFITRKMFFYGWLTILPVFFRQSLLPDLRLLSQPLILGNILFLAVFASFLCYLVWNSILDNLGPVNSSRFLYLDPVAATFVSAIFMHETINRFVIIGLLLIFIGVLYSDNPKIFSLHWARHHHISA